VTSVERRLVTATAESGGDLSLPAGSPPRLTHRGAATCAA